MFLFFLYLLGIANANDDTSVVQRSLHSDVPGIIVQSIIDDAVNKVTGDSAHLERRPPPKVLFISYGDEAYQKKRDALLENATQHRSITEVRGYGKQDALALAASSAETYHAIDLKVGRHAAGWWLWKPLVVYDALVGLADGDVLIYADSQFNFTDEDSVAKRIEIARSAPDDMFAFARWCGVRYGDWCRADVAREIVGDNDMAGFMDAPQFEAGFWLFTKSETTMKFWGAARKLALERPEMFAFEENVTNLSEPNQVSFQDHRHDQSILNALAYKMRINVRPGGSWLRVDVSNKRNLVQYGSRRAHPSWWTELCQE